MLGVVGEQLEGDALERRPGRIDLGQHVDAVTILRHHLLDAANLPLDAPQPGLDLLLVLGIAWHRSIIPPRGIRGLLTTTAGHPICRWWSRFRRSRSCSGPQSA